MLSSIIHSTADVIALILLFGVSIFVHELGHFLVALWCGLQVDTFSIGFGPAMWKKTVKGITYKIGWFPLGGYVALPQLDPSGMANIQGSEDQDGTSPAPRELPRVAAWKKILVSVAGAVGNIFFAFVLAWVIYLSPDPVTEENGGGTLIGFIEETSAAYEAGMRVGDEIIAVNGETVGTWNEFATLCALVANEENDLKLSLRTGDATREISVPVKETDMGVPMVEGIGKSLLCIVGEVMPGGSAETAGVEPGDVVKTFAGTAIVSTEHFITLVDACGGETVPMAVERQGERVTLTVTPAFDPERGRALIGVSISSGMLSSSMPWMQYRKPLDQVKGDATGIFRILKALVTPSESKQAAKGLGGPIMIIAALWISIKVSFLNAIGFLRFLNVNLAILNLLPIPVLDGGHVIFAMWEGITRRRVNPKFANILINIFMILLLSVFVLLSGRDVIRLPRMWRAFKGEPAPVEETTDGEGDTTESPAEDPTDTDR